MLYDIENGIIVDAKIAPVSGNERELAAEHLEAPAGLESFDAGKEPVIFDRGYPSHELIKSLQDKEIGYVMRIPKGFIRKRDMPGARDGWAVLGKDGPRARVIRIPLKSGEVETLITNLGAEKLEYEAFAELYHMRWGIETKYQTVKQKLELENFSGRLVDNIKQDFYAMMTVANMLSSCVRQADAAVKEEREGRETRYEYRVNMNHAVGVFNDRLIGVVIEEKNRRRARLLKELIGEMQRRVAPVRPNREVERKKCSLYTKRYYSEPP
jgi:hypothetical protein